MTWKPPHHRKTSSRPLRHGAHHFDCPPSGRLRLVAVSDSHSEPHGNTCSLIESLGPEAIIHAGDVGDDVVLYELEEIAPTIAVRGNMDSHSLGLPDVATLTAACGNARLSMVMVHIAVQRLRLLGDIRQLAEDRQAGLVIYGHSHQPFLGQDGPFALFNPGSVGPPRFGLPTTLGVIDITESGVDFAHYDVPTRQRWLPGENL